VDRDAGDHDAGLVAYGAAQALRVMVVQRRGLVEPGHRYRRIAAAGPVSKWSAYPRAAFRFGPNVEIFVSIQRCREHCQGV
jgi:hypothetical protein